MKNQLIESTKTALAECLQAIRAEDEQGYDGIAAAMHTGAIVQVTVALSLAGMARVDFGLTLPNGKALHIAHLELDSEK